MRAKYKDINVQIGMRLRNLRIKNGYTQEEIAKSLGVSVEHYNKLENGAYSLSTDKIFILCNQYRFDAAYLITGEKQNYTDPLLFLVNCSDEEYNEFIEQVFYYMKEMLKRKN